MSGFASCREALEFYQLHRPAGVTGRIVYGVGDRWFYTYEAGDGSGWELAQGPYPFKEAAEMTALAEEANETEEEDECTCPSVFAPGDEHELLCPWYGLELIQSPPHVCDEECGEHGTALVEVCDERDTLERRVAELEKAFAQAAAQANAQTEDLQGRLDACRAWIRRANDVLREAWEEGDLIGHEVESLGEDCPRFFDDGGFWGKGIGYSPRGGG